MHAGFVGLGQMGQAMARNLMKAGHKLTVFNRSRLASDALAREGAQAAASPAEAAHTEAVITMLADDHAVEALVLGPRGIVEGLAPGKVHISSSTISPELSRRLAKAHQERGQLYVSAPVFGRPEAAAAGKLFVLSAGTKEATTAARPLLEILGQRVFDVGEQPEHANLIKLLGNFMITCVLESLGETFAVARKAGIDPHAVLDVLTGTLFGAPVYSNYGPRIIDEQFSPPGFKLPLGLKDNRLVMQAAEQLSAPMPFASVVRDRFLAAMANGHGELDWSAMTLAIAQSAGLGRHGNS